MLLNYHIGCFVLSSLCVGDLVRLVLSSAFVAGWAGALLKLSCTKSPTQWTVNKTTDVVIQQHSRKLLMMDILMTETCWVYKKWNKIASDIKSVFYSSIMKVNLLLHQPWRHSDDMVVQLHSFLLSSLDETAWSTSRPGCFTGRKELSFTHWTGGWVDPRAGLGLLEKR